jgi:hypothetical protein
MFSTGKSLMTTLGLLLNFAWSSVDYSAHARSRKLASEEVSSIVDGPRLMRAQEVLKRNYPSMTSFREEIHLPLERGGTSFMGLVARLLGEAPSKEHEGLRTRRYLYHVFENNKSLGTAHGALAPIGAERKAVFVFFDPEGVILNIQIEGLDSAVTETLERGNFIKQFIGKSTEDFELIRGRRGRVQSKGDMLTQTRKPSGGDARQVVDGVLRSLRFNAAFMDVAHFITQHPDLADQASQEFPSAVQVTTQAPQSGPEAFARTQVAGGNPLEGRPFLLQTLKPEKPDEKP